MVKNELDSLLGREYQHGFVTDIEVDTFEPGLDESVIRRLSAIKGEPEFLLEWRLTAFRHWLTLSPPEWSNVHYPPIDYQSIAYYSAPKNLGNGPKSLDEVDPELMKTYEKLGIPLEERAVLAGVAVDAVFDYWRKGGGNPLIDLATGTVGPDGAFRLTITVRRPGAYVVFTPSYSDQMVGSPPTSVRQSAVVSAGTISTAGG